MEVGNEANDIEYILNDIGGAFGTYQIYNYVMLSYAMFVTGTFVLDYVFATLEIDHRCKIDGCDGDVADVIFNPDWLQYSTPYSSHGKPVLCDRFERIGDNDRNRCDVNSFNRSKIINCANEELIFGTDEVSIVNKFNLTCDDSRWKIAMIGTYSNIGRLIALPIVGYLSDWLGRKGVLVTTTVLSSILKVLKSFAVNYSTFVIFEMIDAGLSSAIYPIALILAMELATAKDTILVSCLILTTYPLGQVVTALIASYLHHYQWLLRVISIFGFAMFPFFWMLPESFRWLLVKRKYTQAVKTVESAAKINGIKLSSKTYDIIAMKCQYENSTENIIVESNGTFMDIIKSFSLVTRLMICTFCWVSSTFITYGVSILSVQLQGDKYVNFMVVSFAGMPSILVTYVMLKYMSRRWSMFISFVITGFSILASSYYSNDATISLMFFFLAKLFINHSFTYLYVYTNEMWPTVLRNTVMGFLSMLGRFGSIAAPLAPLLATVSEILPFMLFSIFAFISAVIIIFLPETFKQEKLPDSIDDIKKKKIKMNHTIQTNG